MNMLEISVLIRLGLPDSRKQLLARREAGDSCVFLWLGRIRAKPGWGVFLWFPLFLSQTWNDVKKFSSENVRKKQQKRTGKTWRIFYFCIVGE